MKIYRNILCLALSFLISGLNLSAHESFTKEDYWDGEHYVNTSDLQYQWATAYIKKLNLKGQENVLDIGCGDGRITAFIAQSLPNGLIVGIDASDSMLHVAHNLKNQMKRPNLNFVKRDALNLGFYNAFDLIVSFSCLHWISDHFTALQEMEKALKPGGRVFLYFAPDHGRDRIDHAINAIMALPKWAHYFSDFSNPHSLIAPLKFATYAEEVGLLIRRIENIIVDEIFENKAAFATWMSGWLSQLKKLPKESHQEFLEEIIDYYLRNRPVDPENRVHYIGYWVEVELSKPI